MVQTYAIFKLKSASVLRHHILQIHITRNVEAGISHEVIANALKFDYTHTLPYFTFPLLVSLELY